MRKNSAVVLCLISFLLLGGSSIIENQAHPVLINGKPFANALTINGVLAISAEDFAKAFGGTANLQQAGFRLQGTTLSTLGHVEASAAPNTIGRDAASGMSTGKRMHKPFVITKQSDVSSAILMKNGKAYVPLADVAKAFGGTFTINQGTLKPGESISLNFAVNGNGVLAVAH